MILDKFNLKEKIAIVTGASTGLGQGMTLGLVEAGATVVGVDYVEMPETAKLVEERGGKFHGIVANLLSCEPIDGIIAETVKKFGKLNILVNNAGIIRREDAINFKENDWDDVLNLNLKTVFYFSQAAARQFIKQDTPGNIISVASMLSFQGGIRVPSYTASKSGVMGITKAMANEWAEHNINVNAIAPGYMATNNTAAIRADEARNKAILERIPAGRWGNIEDLQGTVVFLASDASRYLQGYTIAVDGGWLAR